MSMIRRPHRRRQNALSRRQDFLGRKAPRPLLGAEHLEPRAMMAGDLASTYWNSQPPADLSSDAGQLYYGPSADSQFNSLNLQSLANDMVGEGEDPIMVRYRIVPVVAGTNTPITQIQEGHHYELRLLVQDTGVLFYDPDGAGPQTIKERQLLQDNGESALGAFTAFTDLFWDRAQTDVQVNETQTIVIEGSPTTATRFTLRFTDTDNSTETTAAIAFAGSNRFQTAQNIRNALLALQKINLSNNNTLPDVEVVPGNNSRTFHIRFTNGEANKDFANLVGNVTTAGGATGITVTEAVKGDPNSLTSFQEMFRPRPVFDALGDVINDDANDLLYFTNFSGLGDIPAATPITGGVRNTGGNNGPAIFNTSGPRPGTQEVEVFRVRMTAKDKIGNNPVTFVGAYPGPASLATTLLGFIDYGGFIDPANVEFISAALNITEPVSATDDAVSVNEGTNGGTLNKVVIDALGAPGGATSDKDNTGAYNLVLVAPPALPAGQGTVVLRAAGLDGLNRAHFLYTVPNADFNGVVTFQYTIRDGLNAALTDTATVTITVNATNDKPLVSAPATTQVVAEDSLTGLVFSGGNGNTISVSDIDAASGNLSVNLVATNGVLTVPSAPATPGNGTANVTITGTIAEINTALSGLTYSPNANFAGAATITVTANDNGNTGTGGNLTDSKTINISVTATNDEPVNSVPAAAVQVDENSTLLFTGASSISVTDVDAASGQISVNLTTNSVNNGRLSATAAGTAVVVGNNTQNLTITGTLTAVNDTLASLQFIAGLPETVTLTINTSDGGNTGAGGTETDLDTVTINVVATVRPRATPDIFSHAESATHVLDVIANDVANLSPEVAKVTLETVGGAALGSVGSASVGTVQIVDAGVIGDKTDDVVLYTPPFPDFFGTVTFTYTISETPTSINTVNGPNLTGTVTLTIGNVPDAPVAGGELYFGTEDIAVVVSAASGVLANDSDPDNLAPTAANAGLTAELVAGSAVGGTVNLSADGSFVFTPAPNFNGDASFRYRARDPEGNLSAEATVTIELAPANDAPVAVNDGPGGAYVTLEDTPLSISANGVLGNDTDIDSASLTAQLVPGSAVGGTVDLQADGSFIFTPALNFNGTASFRYRASDGESLSNEATVSITVTPDADAPVAGDTLFTLDETQTIVRDATNGVRTLVSDPDQPLGFTGSIALVTSPAQGNLTLNADGSFTYVPPANVTSDTFVSFTYTASDGVFTSNEGTVTFRVTPFNDPPVANNNGLVDGPFAATEDVALTIPRASILGNDFDEETANGDLVAHIVTNVPAAAGSVVVNADGSFTYTPAANFFTALGSPITFTYRVEDEGGKFSAPVAVAINVQEQNDPPIANDDTFSPLIIGQADQALPDPLSNDSVGVDAGAETKATYTITAVNGNATQATTNLGNIVRIVGGQLRFDEISGQSGADFFEYTISDGRGGSATARYDLQVVNFLPKAMNGTVFLDKDNDGRIDAGERRLAGVSIRLIGTNVLGSPVFTPIIVQTDALGRYAFTNLAPGNYTVKQIQPKYLTDGIDRLGKPNSLVTGAANNRYFMAWNVPQSLSTGTIGALNFSERGINAAQLVNSAGLRSEMLASASAEGMVLAVKLTGERLWSYNHLGWNTTAQLQLQVAPNGSIPAALLTVNGETRRIFQNPARNTGTSAGFQTPPVGSSARFRIIGHNGAGDYIIRLDGSMEDFGFVAAAAAMQGEGESAPEMTGEQYRQAADEVFTSKSWA